MADAPSPITSPPAQPFQPYDAQAPASADSGQSTPEQVYDGNGIPGSGPHGGWAKVQDGGAASWSDGTITGGWPPDGTSDGADWKQT
jgi:hypothetical protein